jgi:hypothetical protein
VRTLHAARYVTPLREGGSLPAIVEADDDGLYVVKFRGAGQGPRALAAELIAGELARAAGLDVPEIAFMELDAGLARSEPDPEIQSLIRASAGLNLALDYLPGSVAFDPVADAPDAGLASDIVWLDAYLSNIDRSPRNTNLLRWHRRLWLIDHGAALYVHHAGGDFAARAREAFPQVKDHVLLPFAGDLAGADERMTRRITPDIIGRTVALVPAEWLGGTPPETYVNYLRTRLEAPRAFVEEAIRARSVHL